MRRALFLLILSAAALGGCAAETRIDVPESFVELEDAWLYDLRAVSADGVVLATRRQDNQKNGTLAFWSQVVQNELTDVMGYSLVKAEDVQAASGMPARRMEFTSERAGVKYAYLLVLTADKRNIRIAEAGGPADKVQEHRAVIDKSMLSLR